MSVDPRRKGLDLRKRANEALQAKKPAEAAQLYSKALSDPTGSTRKDHMAALHCGRASAFLTLRGYDFALLDTSAALWYKEDNSRALERRAIAKKALREWTRAAEDFERAAECATEDGFRQRMIAEVKKVKEAEAEEVKLERTRDDHHPRDFEEARVECLSRGDDLSKNSTAQSVLKVCHEIEQGWNRFFETCDPESDYPDIEGLLMVLEASAVDPRALHFTSRTIDTAQLLAKLKLLVSRQYRPFKAADVEYYRNLIPKVGLEGPKGVKHLVNQWIALCLILSLQLMSKSVGISAGIRGLCQLAQIYPALRSSGIFSERLGNIPIENFIIYHTYRSFLSGYRLNNNEGTGLWLQELVIGIRQKHRDGFQAHKKEDPLTTISRKRTVARAHLINAFFAQTMGEVAENVRYLSARKRIYWPNSDMIFSALNSARVAVTLLSTEDEERVFAENVVLCCQLQSKGGNLRSVLSDLARIRVMRDSTEKFFGPSPRNEACELDIRDIVSLLPKIFLSERDILYSRLRHPAKTVDEFLNLRIRPVGTMVGEEEFAIARKGSDPETTKYIDSLPGDLSLWRFGSIENFESTPAGRQ